jgi:DNA-binding NarL/FixJ family response regulator
MGIFSHFQIGSYPIYGIARNPSLCHHICLSSHRRMAKEKRMLARLLIVDDHQVVRLAVRTLFSDNEVCKVCGEADNGMDAIRMVSQLAPDVVILDLSMPGLNGFETAREILKIAPTVKIIFFSAHDIPATARSIGADAFVSKSSTLEELTLAVSRVMQSHKTNSDQPKSFAASPSSDR